MFKRISVALVMLLAACGGGNTTPLGAGGQPIVQLTRPAATDGKFTVNGRYILLNGTKFFVKGVDYSPTPIGKGVSDPPLLDDSLRDANMPIWSRDLPRWRAMGANAIHVYNVVPPPYDARTGPITKFLNAAWNNGNKPVFVVMSIHFPGAALKDRNAAQALGKQYYDLDKKYGTFPAVMGVAISNEILAEEFRNDRAWWDNFNIVAQKAKEGFAAGGNPDKLVTTSEVDGFLAAIHYGELYGAKVDVWGVNIYRGRTFTNMFDEITQYTKKPVMLTEYGATAAYHPQWKNSYTYAKDLKGLGFCTPTTRDGPLTRDVRELPQTGNPKMAGLVDYATNNAKLLYDGYKNQGGVTSGGFYFEWTDEWWKADNGADPRFRSEHVGSLVFNGHFPGCGEDAAWYGLNAISPGTPNKLTPRPTLKAVSDAWASQQ